jgi:pyruvate formate lyase activating enzyme
MKKEASYYKKLDDLKIQCNLCNHNCKIIEGSTGICGVRQNKEGRLYSLIYGLCSSMASDPIEKKPLYHFYPCSKVFSIGTVGCNFGCLFCQNYGISTAKPDFPYMHKITPDAVVNLAKDYGCLGIAFTYNEPSIWYEFTLDSAKLAKNQGLYTVYVTNGYISEDPLRQISSVLDAVNIDIKAFTESFYKKICKAKLQPVLDTCILIKELGIHLELTYLVIPGYNDSEKEIKAFCRWVFDKLDYNIPVHFSRFHPDYKMLNIRQTPMDTMINIFNLAKKIGLFYVYLGNITNNDYEDTICPNCGNVCIKRVGFSTETIGLDKGKCSNCYEDLHIIFQKN